MLRLTKILAGLLTAAILIAACGSSSSSSTNTSNSSTSASSSAGSTSTSTPTANKTLNVPAVTGAHKATLAALGHVKVHKRPHAHWAGLAGMSLTQKMVTIATSVASFWSPLFQGNQLQLPAGTIEIVDQSPGTCGSNQITTNSPPQYCLGNSTVFLPLGYFQSNIAPIGDAAVGLDIADLYGYHIENAMGAFSSNSSVTPTQIRLIDSCFSGLYFGAIQQQLTPTDATAVNKFIAATAPPASQAGAGQVSAEQLTSAFNKGVLARANVSACLPSRASNGGGAGNTGAGNTGTGGTGTGNSGTGNTGTGNSG